MDLEYETDELRRLIAKDLNSIKHEGDIAKGFTTTNVRRIEDTSQHVVTTMAPSGRFLVWDFLDNGNRVMV